MELNNFARIGKGVISKAIGLQDNYKETCEKVTKKLDEEKSGCFSCPVLQLRKKMLESGSEEDMGFVENCCANCPQAVYETYSETEVKYINEENMFGYQKSLKNNAIKLLLAYHFLQPDTIGLVKDVSIKGLAELVGCTPATIISANQTLTDYGYCNVSESGLYNGCVNVMLMEYRNYHKTAAEGGRGYITIPSSLMQKILGIDNINTLRLNLKGMLEVDNESLHNTQDMDMSSATVSYKKLRGFLPDYCKRNVIMKALANKTSIITSSCCDKAVVFEMPDEYKPKKMRASMLENEEKEMKIYIDTLNSVLHKAGKDYVTGEDLHTDTLLLDYHIASHCSYPELKLSCNDLTDLANMCVQYSRSIVCRAVVAIYNQYILYGKSVKKFGALVRTFIRNNVDPLNKAA